MNEVLQAIFSRKGVREYTSRPVEREKVETILKAGTAAPNAYNHQLWHFTAVMDPDLIAKIDNEAFMGMVRAGKRAPEPVYHPVHEAPVLIVISSDIENEFAKQDCSCACQNMALAAHSLGLGSRFLNVPVSAFEGEIGPELKDACDIPKGHCVVCCLCVGYPKDANQPPTEKRQDVFSIID